MKYKINKDRGETIGYIKYFDKCNKLVFYFVFYISAWTCLRSPNIFSRVLCRGAYFLLFTVFKLNLTLASRYSFFLLSLKY